MHQTQARGRTCDRREVRRSRKQVVHEGARGDVGHALGRHHDAVGQG